MEFAGNVHIPCHLAVNRGQTLFGMMYFDQFFYESIDTRGRGIWAQYDLYFGLIERAMQIAEASEWKGIIFHLNESIAIARSVAGLHPNATPRATRIFGRLLESNHQNPIHVLFSQADQGVFNFAQEMIRRNNYLPKTVGSTGILHFLGPGLQVNRG